MQLEVGLAMAIRRLALAGRFSSPVDRKPRRAGTILAVSGANPLLIFRRQQPQGCCWFSQRGKPSQVSQG